MNGPVRIPPKKRISRSFGLKASKYEKYAEVQQKFQHFLIERILNENSQGTWIDLGCGTGFLFSRLNALGWRAPCIGMDLSIPSIRHLKKRSDTTIYAVQADIEHLPIKKASLHGAVFSSVLQWINDIDSFFKSLHTILHEEGKIFFSIFTNGSFNELSTVRKLANLSDPISLPDTKCVSEMLKRSGFKKITLFEHKEIIYFVSAQKLLKSLSAIGSTAVSEKPMTRSQLHTFCTLLETKFKTAKGVPLTYKAAIGWAQKE